MKNGIRNSYSEKNYKKRTVSPTHRVPSPKVEQKELLEGVASISYKFSKYDTIGKLNDIFSGIDSKSSDESILRSILDGFLVRLMIDCSLSQIEFKKIMPKNNEDKLVFIQDQLEKCYKEYEKSFAIK